MCVCVCVCVCCVCGVWVCVGAGVCAGPGGGGGGGAVNQQSFIQSITFFVTIKEIIPPFSVMLLLRATFFLKDMDESSSRVS